MQPQYRAPAIPATGNPPIRCFTNKKKGNRIRNNHVFQRTVSLLQSRIPILFLIAAVLIVQPVIGNQTEIMDPHDKERAELHMTPHPTEAAMQSDLVSASGIPDEVPGSMTFPAIRYNATPGSIIRRFDFSFQQTGMTIETNVSTALYYGAKNGDKYAIVPPGTIPESVAPDYYRAFIDDPLQEPLYDSILEKFRLIRTERRYSDDEYIELLTVFVQSIPYDDGSDGQSDTTARFPVETIVDGTGDCDDKSVLLAGLLSREGYNVSLLLFIPEHHMAVGISGDRGAYQDTGYIYIETTGLSFVGEAPGSDNESVKIFTSAKVAATEQLTGPPLVIRVGEGHRDYSSAEKTGYILLMKKAADTSIASIRERMDNQPPEDQEERSTLIQKYSTYAEIHNYIVMHRDDREGTFRYLMLKPLPDIPSCNPGDECLCPDIRYTTWKDTAAYTAGTWAILMPPQCIWQSVRQAFGSYGKVHTDG